MVPERDALTALAKRIGDLHREISVLAAGVTQIVAGQEAHTALLQALLSAVADLGTQSDGDGLAEALARIADSLDEQTETLDGMRAGLDALPGAVVIRLGAGRAA
ncbi:hypothetical protein [Methylobacterium nonmethylotrophicum]|uniref:Uncharacterized protein n=1 Tax=Methylobacterium nonmethylotrophicum TaxID=1141884 RepID=A0A4Z0NGJ4_9HYPH|nr:hypothetical protein [Methylobacterium nonmethylotrophicum]TGD94593.1 hypothetical protein EU555_32080 [Methylobacterium nonmethylotrophicum]